MERNSAFLVVVVPLIAGVYAESLQEALHTRNRTFDNYMGLWDGFKQLSSRALMDCHRECTVMQCSCMSNTFDPATKLCHLFNRTLTSTDGLQPTSGAVYHYKAFTDQFKCPEVDGEYHFVKFIQGKCIKIRVSSLQHNHDDAFSDCEATGGRLFVVDTEEKKSLFVELANCQGLPTKSLVDGTNINATDYLAADAYTTDYGEIITVGDLLWKRVETGWHGYKPTTEHCLFYHNDHHHTASCTSALESYYCEEIIFA